MTREKLIHHLESLREKHDDLDKQIRDMYGHHDSDLKVEEMKKKKLKLKDEMEQMRQKINKLDQ